ncbi:MAG: hypothetical protein LIP06_06400 [Tannerellaceae bacterium]|nr:hypothetical protein [Tannerellaceae bacterium]
MRENDITPLHHQLLLTAPEENPLSFSKGKMGKCIYFYVLSRLNKQVEFEKIAENLLDEVFEKIDTIHSIDVQDGLAGIGLGMIFLIKKNYIQGNINEVVKEIDNVILKHMSYAKYYDTLSFTQRTQILFYLCLRLKDQKKNRENEFIYQEVIIHTLNTIYEKIDTSLTGDSLIYTIFHPFFQFLYVTSEIHTLHFYNDRIERIWQELTPSVLSLFPVSHSNRLYLSTVIEKITGQWKNREWEQHLELLKRETNLHFMLEKEIKDKNIYFSYGLTSLLFLISNRGKEIETTKYLEYAFRKIESSEAWSLLENDPEYFKKHSGLWNGFCGAYLALQYWKNPIQTQTYEN